MFRERDSTVYLPKDLERFVAEEYPVSNRFEICRFIARKSSIQFLISYSFPTSNRKNHAMRKIYIETTPVADKCDKKKKKKEEKKKVISTVNKIFATLPESPFPRMIDNRSTKHPAKEGGWKTGRRRDRGGGSARI